jgi:hypothetical protein
MLNNLKLDGIEPMVTIPVSEVEVRSIIKSLKSKGTSGYDGISSKILKQCASTVIKPLTYTVYVIYLLQLELSRKGANQRL